ncbi:hypothetical protein DC094_19305 [Pelagibaculum spongiae]|uniref:Uncharacterized protein n=1 Tax=Pelagibaculum spongiae TaxID=2080658 RepID=A0A2V1GX90_9GAMM|nr:hypothetical protein DC094_19305 [Pelagibaculum spongiae]
MSDSGLRFDESVPVTVIHVQPDELKGPHADEYEIIGSRTTHRLAQRRSAHEILEYHIPILKRKGKVITPKAPSVVLPMSASLQGSWSIEQLRPIVLAMLNNIRLSKFPNFKLKSWMIS